MLFIREEMKKKVWSCDSSKVLGYDGFNMGFIKSMWSILDGKVVDMVFDFFCKGEFLRKINMIWMILILKKD